MSERSSSMRMTTPNIKRNYLSLFTVIGLMLLTLYMAFAFPFTIFQLKQKETTQLKSVIIIGRSGEKSPTPESYFMDEEPPEELYRIGFEQLTNVGKQRMYMLGKFLKLRYYHLLLEGNPRMLSVRSADLDRTLESTQALLAGLNPPKDSWLWAPAGSDTLNDWQPKAIHTTSASNDDLLSVQPNCDRLKVDKINWKNSTKYLQLVNEFRHDLQTLRINTGLEFEDDLEMLGKIEDSLKTRQAFQDDVPAWYTPTFADRLSHIVDVTTGNWFSSPEVQRVYAGRLLDEIVRNINKRIRIDQEQLAAMAEIKNAGDRSPLKQLRPTVTRTHGVIDEPKVLIYMTDTERLAALLNSLQVYTSLPPFGSVLLIELHYDPINRVYFLRLYTVSSTSSDIFPEPLRVNPIACSDSVECSTQQFEQNISNLMLNKSDWQEVCNNVEPRPTSTPKPMWPATNNDNAQTNNQLPNKDRPTNDKQSSSSTTTQAPLLVSTESFSTSSADTTSSLDKLDDSLIVGPTSVQTESTTTVVTLYNSTLPEMVVYNTTISGTELGQSTTSQDSTPMTPAASKEATDDTEIQANKRSKFNFDPRVDSIEDYARNSIDRYD